VAVFISGCEQSYRCPDDCRIQSARGRKKIKHPYYRLTVGTIPRESIVRYYKYAKLIKHECSGMMLEYIYAKTSVKALIRDEEIAQQKISL